MMVEEQVLSDVIQSVLEYLVCAWDIVYELVLQPLRSVPTEPV